jgi:hypothetical protein
VDETQAHVFDVESIRAMYRLREISDEIVALKAFAEAEPANVLLINLLEGERSIIKKLFIRAVPCENSNL